MCVGGLQRPRHSGRDKAHPEVVQGEVSEHRPGDVRGEHVEENDKTVCPAVGSEASPEQPYVSLHHCSGDPSPRPPPVMYTIRRLFLHSGEPFRAHLFLADQDDLW